MDMIGLTEPAAKPAEAKPPATGQPATGPAPRRPVLRRGSLEARLAQARVELDCGHARDVALHGWAKPDTVSPTTRPHISGHPPSVGLRNVDDCRVCYPCLMSDSLYVPDGDVMIPTEFSRGPWFATAQHGGPPSGLLTRAVEQHRSGPEDDPSAYLVSRMTVELLRPVPLTPLRVTSATTRPGRKVQLITASLWAGEAFDVEVARAVGLRLLRAPISFPFDVSAPNAEADAAILPAFGPDQGHPPTRAFDGAVLPAFHANAVDMRFIRGDLGAGPGAMWMRLRVPIVAGEEASPAQRAVTLSDFCNAIGSFLPMTTHTYLNADLTVNLHRMPDGEWICADSVMRIDETGIGLAAAQLSDHLGPVGRATQSLLIAERPV